LLKNVVLNLEISDWLIITVAITTYSVIFSYYSIMKFYSFRVGAWDFGIVAQSIASASRGRLFTNNVELYYSPTGSYFGIHFSPILFLVVPFFYLMPKIETLYIFQTVTLALGCIPVYLLAKKLLNNRAQSLILSISYLFNPALQSINWYDFTPQVFFPTLILFATYYLKECKIVLFFLFLMLSLTTLEQSSYYVLLFGFYVVWDLKKQLMNLFSGNRAKLSFVPIATFTITIFWAYFSSSVKSIINPSIPEELLATGNFRILGVKSINEIPLKIVSDPSSLLRAFRYDMMSKVFYIIVNLASNCFLSILSPIALLPALLWLVIASVSNWPPYYQLGFHYPAFTLPFIYVATIETLKRFRHDINEQKHGDIIARISILVLVVNIIISSFLSPLSPVHEAQRFTYFRDYGISHPSSLNLNVIKILSEIPNDAKVITTSMLFPHLAIDNLNTYVIPPENVPSRRLYVSHTNYLKQIKFDYVIISYLFWDKNEAEHLYKMFVEGNREYNLFIYAPGLEIYRRGYEEKPKMFSLRFSYKELYTFSSEVVDDYSSESGKVIKFIPSQTSGSIAWFGPYTCLRPGNYTIKFKVRIDSTPVDEKIITLDVWSNSLQKRIAYLDLYGRDFSKALVWHTFTIKISLPTRIIDIEFRGVDALGEVTIWLDYIEVVPE
ncbi:MAG: DUF2079 domain-containing protein, partial [Candidatus Bathyarchaeia archaeon]